MLEQFDEQAFATALATALKQSLGEGEKAPANVAGTNWIHGPGGILGSCAIDSQVISARISPRGISRVLPCVPTVSTNPEYAFITGIEDSGDSEPTTECATCPSGITQSCIQSAVFGLLCRETDTLTINRAIERINKNEVDLQLVNDILGLQPKDVFQAIASANYNTLLQVATAWAMIEVGVLLQNKLVPMVWQGNPANNIGTGYAEFPGLDLLISTNYVDAHTGANCNALDADVKSFNWLAVNNQDGAGNFSIVRVLEYLEAYVHSNAERMGLMPATWTWVMRRELWYELSNIWPIAYLTTRGMTTAPPGAQLMVDATREREMRDQMRRGYFLSVNGRTHPVVIDDGVYEYTEEMAAGNLMSGEYASTIYLLPVTYLGNRPATYFEAKDYRAITPDVMAGHLQDAFWSDDGRFLWTNERVKWCYTLSGKVEPRVLLRTPMISGKLEYVKYTPLQHFRDFDEDSDYFFKGGEPERPSPSFWGPWNLPPNFAR